MGWSGGSYSKGNAGTGGWAGDASAGIGIEAGRHDTQDNDFATGINQCINKDGSNSMTGNLNIGTFEVRNASKIGVGTSSPAAPIDVSNANTFSATANESIRLTNTSATGQATIQSNINGTLRGRIRWDFAGNTNYVSNGGGHVWYTGGDSGVGTSQVTMDASGNVGVNTGSPAERVHIVSGVDDNTLRLQTTGNRPSLNFNRSGTNRAQLFTDGGSFITGSADALCARVGGTGGVYVASGGTSWLAVSDGRFKKNVQNLDYGLEQIKAMRAVRFDYIDDVSNSSARMGFIAQEVKPLIPEIVVGDEQIKLGVCTQDLIPVLLKAIQELSAKVEALENQLSATTETP
jgi:hypothetical protein